MRIILTFLVVAFFQGGFSRESKLSTVSEQRGDLVEYAIISPEEGSSHLLVFLHGGGGERGLHEFDDDWCGYWLEKGYSIGLISLPGFGKSSGKKDMCGPRSMEALQIAIDEMKKEVGAKDFGIIGTGQGALAGLLLASKRSDIRCVVAANGVYNFLRHIHSDCPLIKGMINQNYEVLLNDNESLRIRSPMFQAYTIEAPLFLLHREKNSWVSICEVEDFAELMTSLGIECNLSILKLEPGRHARKIGDDEILSEVSIWVDSHMNQ